MYIQLPGFCGIPSLKILKLKIVCFVILSVLISLSFAYAEDPFSRSFSTPSTVTGDLTLTDDGSESVHPMMKYDVAKYFVKGVIVSLEGSIAVMSIPGGKDYIMFPGDPRLKASGFKKAEMATKTAANPTKL